MIDVYFAYVTVDSGIVGIGVARGSITELLLMNFIGDSIIRYKVTGSAIFAVSGRVGYRVKNLRPGSSCDVSAR